MTGNDVGGRRVRGGTLANSPHSRRPHAVHTCVYGITLLCFKFRIYFCIVIISFFFFFVYTFIHIYFVFYPVSAFSPIARRRENFFKSQIRTTRLTRDETIGTRRRWKTARVIIARDTTRYGRSTFSFLFSPSFFDRAPKADSTAADTRTENFYARRLRYSTALRAFYTRVWTCAQNVAAQGAKISARRQRRFPRESRRNVTAGRRWRDEKRIVSPKSQSHETNVSCRRFFHRELAPVAC